MTNPDRDELVKLADTIEAYGFECEGGPLKNCKPWQELLRRLASSGSGVKVRELEWRDDRHARSIVGVYGISAWSDKKFTLTKPPTNCTDGKLFDTLDAAKAAAQADYEARIMAAIEIAPQSDRRPSPSQKQVSETGKELPENAEQPMNNADVSVGELAGFFVTEFPHLLTMSTQIEVARALLDQFEIRRKKPAGYTQYTGYRP